MNYPSTSRDAIPLLNNIYIKSLIENEKNVRFWEDYLKSLKDLDFNVYSNKLKVPILVPIGNRILFRGELKHTNEVTVALGADYFAKCSLNQAEVLRQHRIKDAETKLKHFKNERDYIEGKMQFSTENIFAKSGEEIMEPFNEDEDKTWRKIHRENIRRYKQNKSVRDEEVKTGLTDAELWERLEELELKEELENEFDNVIEKKSSIDHQNYEHNANAIDESKDNEPDTNEKWNVEHNVNAVEEINVNEADTNKKWKDNNNDTRKVTKSSEDILEKVLEKQSELEQKLLDLKNRERVASKTEDELMSRLDELEQLDELEDDIDRLDDILYNNEEEQLPLSRKTSVCFADQNDAETKDITFSHSETAPDLTPYDSSRGVSKPSDIYNAFPQLFKEELTSILKKTNYDPSMNKSCKEESYTEELNGINTFKQTDVSSDVKAIEIKDVQENVDVSESVVENTVRPPSLFKLRRQQQKN